MESSSGAEGAVVVFSDTAHPLAGLAVKGFSNSLAIKPPPAVYIQARDFAAVCQVLQIRLW